MSIDISFKGDALKLHTFEITLTCKPEHEKEAYKLATENAEELIGAHEGDFSTIVDDETEHLEYVEFVAEVEIFQDYEEINIEEEK